VYGGDLGMFEKKGTGLFLLGKRDGLPEEEVMVEPGGAEWAWAESRRSAALHQS